MIAIGRIMSLAKGIIDDTCLVIFHIKECFLPVWIISFHEHSRFVQIRPAIGIDVKVQGSEDSVSVDVVPAGQVFGRVAF